MILELKHYFKYSKIDRISNEKSLCTDKLQSLI